MFKVVQWMGPVAHEYTCVRYKWSGATLIMVDVDGYMTAPSVSLSTHRGEIEIHPLEFDNDAIESLGQKFMDLIRERSLLRNVA